MTIQHNNKNYIKGFTLVEISIVLLIIGILTSAILKGKNMIESAKIESVINDIRTIQMAYNQYINITSNKPDTTNFFKQLKSYELIESETFKNPRIGNLYSVIEQNNHQYLKLNNLTEKQIILLSAKIKVNFGENISTISDNNTSISIQID